MPRDACCLARLPLTKVAGEGRQRWKRAGEPFRMGLGELSTLTTFGHWLPGSRGMDPASLSLVSGWQAQWRPAIAYDFTIPAAPMLCVANSPRHRGTGYLPPALHGGDSPRAPRRICAFCENRRNSCAIEAAPPSGYHAECMVSRHQPVESPFAAQLLQSDST